MKSVSAASRPWTASANSEPSTLATKRTSRSRFVSCRSAWWAIAGPRSDPPMPMFTTVRIGLPVCPTHSPDRTRSENAAIRSRTAWTSGTTFSPSTTNSPSRGMRSATWPTARSSVTLMCSPANIASMRARSPAASARPRSRVSVSSSTRFFE